MRQQAVWEKNDRARTRRDIFGIKSMLKYARFASTLVQLLLILLYEKYEKYEKYRLLSEAVLFKISRSRACWFAAAFVSRKLLVLYRSV